MVLSGVYRYLGFLNAVKIMCCCVITGAILAFESLLDDSPEEQKAAALRTLFVAFMQSDETIAAEQV